MLLKQNCFVISDAEYTRLENDTYIVPKFGYTGSSLQRTPNKNNEFNYKERKTDKDFLHSDSSTTFADQWLGKIKENKEIRSAAAERRRNSPPIDHSLSQRSKSKLRNKIIAWANCIPVRQSVKFTFITLTLTSPQIGSDKDFTKMQNVFFTYLRKYYRNSFLRYIYVLERQTLNTNNVHSHILCSAYLPIVQINRIWCKVLSDHGYTYNQNGAVVTPIDALRNKANDKSLSTPSPVDISLVHDLKSVTRYVTKYITKNDSSMQTNIWNCSGWVSRLWTGANICAKTHFLALKRNIVTESKISLDNGYEFTVYLLNGYTPLQRKIFGPVNKYPIPDPGDKTKNIL